MDGVLVDSHQVHRKAWRLFLQTLGREAPDSELNFILDGRKRGDILRHFLGDCSESQMEEFGRRKDCIFRQMRLDVSPIPGAVDLVRDLDRNGVALALATSASRSRAHSTVVDLGLLTCFQQIVTGEDVLLGKPDGEIYRLARQRLGVDSEHLLAAEDAISGVRAAVAAGLRCVALASHENAGNLAAAGAVHVLQDFENVATCDLEAILLKGNLQSQQASAGGN
jgi:beta-phosphoglucomutase